MDPIDMMVCDHNCEYLGLSRLCLMENAGKSLSDEVATLSTFKFSKPVKIVIFTGSGGNGGDGFVAARHLLNRGFEVDVYSLASPEEIKSIDSLINLEILMNLKPRISRLGLEFIRDSSDLDKIDFGVVDEEFIVLDCLLGTGIKGKLRSKVRKTVELINEIPGLTVAVDVPSGLDPLTGEIADICVKADYTVSFHKVKTGVKLADEDYVGGSITCDIGIPLEAEFFVEGGDLLRFKPRKSDSHKGQNGSILVVGGSEDYYGAPAIASKAAIATGVDLTYIYTSKLQSNAIKSLSEDFIVFESNGDNLSIEDSEDILNLVDKVDAVLLGPGAGCDENTMKLFNVLAMKINKPLVLDADALKIVKRSLIAKKDNVVITPHLAEFKTFFSDIIREQSIDLDKKYNDLDFNDVDKKVTNLQKITRSINGSVILKGENDYIFNGTKFKINRSGNPGMTCGGSGDALAGIVVSLLAQGLNPFNSAILATFFNGTAGDLAMEDLGYGYGCEDLIKYLSVLMQDLI